MANLDGLRVAILATDLVEEAELVEPRKALMEAGATTELISPKSKAGDVIQAVNHADKAGTHKVDVPLAETDPDNYDALLLPGAP
jgi:protease I